MRIAISLLVVVALPIAARADDDCRGDDAWTERCSLTWPMREGRKPGAFAIGWASDALDPSGRTFDVTRSGSLAPVVGHVDGSQYALLRGNGFFVDVRLLATPRFYAGVHLDAAWLDTIAPRGELAASAGMPTWDGGAILTMAGLAGVRIPLGRFALRGELVAGIHGATLVASSQQLSADSGVAPLIAPRLAIDAWLSRFATLEVYAGDNLLAPTERVFGIGLGVHLQAFDGRY